MTKPELVQKTLEKCKIVLSEIDFRQKKQQIFIRENQKGNLHWLGILLEEHREADSIFISPNLGYRNQELHRKIAEIENESFHSFLPPTVAQNVGYLLAGEKKAITIRVNDEDSALYAAKSVANAVRQAESWLTECEDLNMLCRKIPELATWEDAGERLLVLGFMLGYSPNVLEEFVENRVREGRKDGKFFERFEQFSEKFLKWVYL